MRFFFELVPCCGSPTRHVQESVVPSEHEERWLVTTPTVSAVPSRRSVRKKLRKAGASDWRPSLGSISEDFAPAQKPLNGDSAGKGAKKRCAAAGGMRTYRPSYSDRYNGFVSNQPQCSRTRGTYSLRHHTNSKVMPSYKIHYSENQLRNLFAGLAFCPDLGFQSGFLCY